MLLANARRNGPALAVRRAFQEGDQIRVRGGADGVEVVVAPPVSRVPFPA